MLMLVRWRIDSLTRRWQLPVQEQNFRRSIMKSNERHTQYKGLKITIRWTELERHGSFGPGGHRYTASYLIAAQDAKYGTWHHLPDDVFVSFDTAAA